jgi:hypothetical protein
MNLEEADMLESIVIQVSFIDEFRAFKRLMSLPTLTIIQVAEVMRYEPNSLRAIIKGKRSPGNIKIFEHNAACAYIMWSSSIRFDNPVQALKDVSKEVHTQEGLRGILTLVKEASKTTVDHSLLAQFDLVQAATVGRLASFETDKLNTIKKYEEARSILTTPLFKEKASTRIKRLATLNEATYTALIGELKNGEKEAYTTALAMYDNVYEQKDFFQKESSFHRLIAAAKIEDKEMTFYRLMDFIKAYSPSVHQLSRTLSYHEDLKFIRQNFAYFVSKEVEEQAHNNFVKEAG